MTPHEICVLAGEVEKKLADRINGGSDVFVVHFARAIEAAALNEVEKNLIHERSLYLSKWKREAITACIDRVRALAKREG